ncbi:MAG: preprotein translocase subunit SecE [Lachnospirales bacterium]
MDKNAKNDTALKKENKLVTEFNGVKSEAKRIVWPSRETLISQTISVVVVSLLIGIIIFFYDTIFELVLDFLVSIL